MKMKVSSTHVGLYIVALKNQNKEIKMCVHKKLLNAQNEQT